MGTGILTFDDLATLGAVILCTFSGIVFYGFCILLIEEIPSRCACVDHKPAKLLQCGAVVQGLNNERPLSVQISAKRLPGRGETLRALCKWPRLTANGWREDGDFYWCDVTVADGAVRIVLVHGERK